MLAVLLYSVNDEARKEGPHDLSVVRSRLRHFQVQKRGDDTLRARWELASGRTCIAYIREFPRVSYYERRISGKFNKMFCAHSLLMYPQ